MKSEPVFVAEVADYTTRSYVEVVKPLLNHEVIVETVEGSLQGRLLNFEKVAPHIYIFILLQNYPNWLIIPESHVITVKKA